MIIGLSGKKQSGKSTTAEFLRHAVSGSVEINFAEPLKRICMDVFGAKLRHVSGTDDEKNEVIPNLGITGRELMQRLGKFGRSITPDVWPDCWKNSVAAHWATEGVQPIIVSDVRFKNEVEAIRGQGGIVLRLTRAPFVDSDESENDLDDYDGFDAVIDNAKMTREQTFLAVSVECERLGVV